MFAAILLAALYLNRKDLKTFLFALLVAFTYYFPTELITDKMTWYLVCIGFELFVIATCITVENKVSLPLGLVTFLMTLLHIISYAYPREIAYSFTAKYLEYMQILSFILVSPTVIDYLKRKLKLCLQKCGCGC